MTTRAALQTLIAQGESETLELNRSTAELKRAGETLCAFLNGEGGKVLIGVAPDGKLVGQDVADITLRDIAAMLGRFEPPARVEMSRVDVENGRQVIVLEAVPSRQFAPFVFESKPYKRVGSTTTVMSQEEYGRLLLDRNHSRHRWENQPALGVRLEDLDREEILRTRATAIEQRRLSAGTSMDVSDILDRLGLRIDGQVTQAAQMLYGTKFLPDYPQALLKLGRFRGTKITGDILDNQQLHLHAFAMVREAIAWLDRTLPLAARFPKGSIFREDRQPVPAEALRETIINAVIHRDVSNPSSYVAIAVFDDRIEIHSIGDFPTGIRAELLTQEHRSIPRNPLIAGAFHRTGAIEVWGRGTNRVIEACRAWGIEAPTFKVEMGVMTVTFRAEIRPGGEAERAGAKTSQGTDLVGDSVTDSVGDPVDRLLGALESGPLATAQLQKALGLKHRPTFKENYLKPALAERLIEMTVPDKPSSRLQKYRLTDAGRARLSTKRGGAP
ncbi:MAG: putative DNA binding domain-containing protein [Proteobacteria bacterium]|nr:putative DNA binding domain-containing protein [Pseudomonadota bacterium]